MSDELSNLCFVPGSQKRIRRLGRGIGSGRGKTAGRGVKGQNSRSGSSRRPGFEGGQMPLQRRLGKRGFTNIHAVAWDIVNLKDLERLGAVSEVDLAALVSVGLASGNRPVKVLGDGDLQRPLKVRAQKFSASAVAKIEAAGGQAEVI